MVVGAGAFGGWTAFELIRRGARVTLLDAWGAGHTRASSGGETRVIRAVYGPDRIYSEMVRTSFERWAELDRMSAEPLYVETGTLWLHRGDDSYVRAAVPILRDLGFPIDPMTPRDARRRYPQVSLDGVKSIWFERKAGALSARQSCIAIRDHFQKAGGTYRVAHAEPGQIAKDSIRAVRLADGTRIEADAFVFACGPWLGRVFPEVVGGGVRPTRQEVFYFGLPRGSKRYAPDALPIWIDFGARIFYGIPDINGRGFKIADDTRGDDFDPTSGSRTPTEEGIARVRQLLGERFPELASAPLISAEVCQYENSPDGHLIIDRHPRAKNVWIVGGGSGHGFKLAPAVGKIVADAILDAKEPPPLFNVARLRDVKKPSTQFETNPKS